MRFTSEYSCANQSACRCSCTSREEKYTRQNAVQPVEHLLRHCGHAARLRSRLAGELRGQPPSLPITLATCFFAYYHSTLQTICMAQRASMSSHDNRAENSPQRPSRREEHHGISQAQVSSQAESSHVFINITLACKALYAKSYIICYSE